VQNPKGKNQIFTSETTFFLLNCFFLNENRFLTNIEVVIALDQRLVQNLTNNGLGKDDGLQILS